MSQDTLEYHWGKHHRAYVENLNKQITGTELDEMSLDQVVLVSYNKGDFLPSFNNAAQVCFFASSALAIMFCSSLLYLQLCCSLLSTVVARFYFFYMIIHSL